MQTGLPDVFRLLLEILLLVIVWFSGCWDLQQCEGLLRDRFNGIVDSNCSLFKNLDSFLIVK